jgi:surface polysaccharide O-acyltransferase-like enzyme
MGGEVNIYSIAVARPGAAEQSRGMRLEGIDAMRAGMGLLVVLCHSLTYGSRDHYSDLANAIGILSRAAVPFFLISSGYFLKAKARFSTEMLSQPAVRLLPIYVFWMIIYYGWVTIFPGHMATLRLKDLLSGGVAFHLWFLPALGISLALVATGLSTVGWRATGLACLALALVAIARGAYHDVLHLGGAASRGGLLVAPLFVYIGAYLRRAPLSLRLGHCLVTLLTCYGLLYLEDRFIAVRTGAAFVSHDFALAVIPLGISAFLTALALKDSDLLRGIASLGRSSLTRYASHLLLLWAIFALNPTLRPDVKFVNGLAAFAAATLLGLLLQRIRLLRPFVM